MDAPTGTLIAYATGPGRVAADGDGRNSPFTKHLLAQIKRPGQKAEEVFKKMRVGVRKDTDNKQTPWEASSLTEDFYFAGGVKGTDKTGKPDGKSGKATSGIDPTVEVTFWNSVHPSQDPEMYRIYLADYPRGRFVRIADRMIKKLESSVGWAKAPSAVPISDGRPQTGPRTGPQTGPRTGLQTGSEMGTAQGAFAHPTVDPLAVL
uniref:Caspase domain-containing protein n=1 Tax=Candidatus Kentrum sp. TUN TaxID=2126343 RepID=A0A450ZLY3_9GAMM|nr:MAG: Caspase domain-containing protein [Candidatus Kentron sp. TUN]VFK58946.1 MAG: Caspase domain-containing protein [Candidatus Kentron sp. TUN]